MAKYKDKTGVGRSKICPFKPLETAKQRHTRRRRYNLRNVNKVREFCSDNRLKLTVTNHGHHWRVFRDIKSGKKVLEWWPSTAKVVYNKTWQHGIHCHDYLQFIILIKKYFRRK